MKMNLLVALTILPGFVNAVDNTPMAQTVQLIEGLAKQVRSDGVNEQESFDKYACWCEKTMERKASDIGNGKELASETQTLIGKLKAEIASHGAEIQQLNKDIAQNNAAVKEATDIRNKENGEYSKERSESEQCIGALEAAVKALTGAGTKSFLQGGNLHEVEILSVVAGVRTALSNKVATQTLSNSDIEIMKHFVSRPSDFVGGQPSKAMSAAQVGQNPFGDYAPQSTQIQGILKGMYDAFTMDLEKENANEADTQKSFEELHATKMQELATLEATLETQESDEAAKTKKQAESEVLLDDTNAQRKADEEFFEDTKDSCKEKATQWSVRTRLRTEELNGMETAITILSSKDAKKTFESSTTTFLQLASIKEHTERGGDRNKAFVQLQKLAQKFGSRSVAKIAVEVRSGGHFDKVIVMIDQMIGVLRKEEQDDIEHRDRCENNQNANKNEMADLDHEMKKTTESLARMKRTKGDLEKDITAVTGDIQATEDDMASALKFRNNEEALNVKALQDDTDAIALLKKALAALSKFYKDNKIALPGLIQKKAPEYEDDKDKAPEASFSGDYGGRKSESGGILAILEMLVEDTQKEVAEGRADNADAQAKYQKVSGALQNSLDAQEESKSNLETEKADLMEKIASYEQYHKEKETDFKAEESTEESIGTDCAWVKSNFNSRRDKRKTEEQGLVDAKAFLAGVAAGDDPLPM